MGSGGALILATMLLLPAASPAVAQNPVTRDTDAPIEIESDRLEVRQEKNLAIFSGNVIAIQGAVTLKTKEMRVTYRKRKDGETRSPDDTERGVIARLEAFGDVMVISSTEQATGDKGVYDIDTDVITLTGNVVLTNKDGKLSGQALRMDLNGEISTLTGAADGRVKGIFVPKKESE